MGWIGEDVTKSWRMVMVKMTLKYIAPVPTMGIAEAVNLHEMGQEMTTTGDIAQVLLSSLF